MAVDHFAGDDRMIRELQRALSKDDDGVNIRFWPMLATLDLEETACPI
jgi:hypothetical protein